MLQYPLMFGNNSGTTEARVWYELETAGTAASLSTAKK